MIEMSMCDQHLLDRHAMMLGTLQQTLRLAAGIDQRTPHGGVVPDQRTILLERRARNNFAAQAHVRDTEIGRATGRERVSQYVKLSGVAVSLKTNKKNIKQ